MTSSNFSLAEGQRFVADLADALNVSFKAVDPHSEAGIFRRTVPSIRQDYLIFGEQGCFEGGATLARVRLVRDLKYDGEILVTVHQYDPEVIPHAVRLFSEQSYKGVGFSYIAGPDVKNRVKLLRRHWSEAA
ncbi:MAG: hypothetical protein ABH864_02895 [archaeon]